MGWGSTSGLAIHKTPTPAKKEAAKPAAEAKKPAAAEAKKPAPAKEPVIVSLFDRKIFVDFSFSDSAFLLVSGEMTPGCKFRIARGEGAQSGHPQPVTLACDG